MKNYYLIIIALSVLQEIEHAFAGNHFANDDDVAAFIQDQAEKKDVDWDFHLEIGVAAFSSVHDARIYRDGALATFDDQEDSGECLDLVMIDEDGNTVTAEL